MCVLIFACKKSEVEGNWASSCDVQVTPIWKPTDKIVDASNLDNHGPGGKYFPGDPKCEYNGKIILTLVFTAPRDSMTGEILVELKNIWIPSICFRGLRAGLFLALL